MKNLKKILLSPWTALITLTLLLSIRVVDPSFVESVRLRYFDTLITSKAPTENNIYTVNIDEKALEKYGQWPFNRQIHAKLIEDLYKRGAGLVVYNVLMPEPDRQGGDVVLAETLSKYPVILSNVPSNQSKNKPRQPGLVIIGPEESGAPTYTGIIANVPMLESKAIGSGTTNTMAEIDGVNRRMPLIVEVKNNNGNLYYPSLSMETLRVAAGDTTVQIKLNENGVEKMRIPKFGPISTDSQGRVWIDWSQKSKSVSMTDLPKDFGGAIVIVGTTAAGIANPLPTPIGPVWPQEVQSSVVGTMINGVVIERPDWADGAELLSTLLLCIITLFLTRYTHGYIAIIGLGIASYWGSHELFGRYLSLIDITYPLLTIFVVYGHGYTVKFLSELHQKLQIKKQFGTYLSPAMVEKLQKNPELLVLGGESRELSIMFTDVRGFTTISEHYGKDVQGLTKIMNRYMTAMTAKIIENNGTLDKYIGDAQMAFWNAPLDDAQHAKNAVKTGLAMLDDLDKFNEEITKEGIPAFGMGLGINTDTVVVGNMGSAQRFDYTCLGDGVNLASRLEGQSKPYGVRIVLGTKTAEYVKDEYPVVELDCIAVKGKTEGVKIYTIAPPNELHDTWLDLYYRGQWNKALILVDQLKNVTPELSQYYDNMAERLREGVPSNWDGTYRATSK